MSRRRKKRVYIICPVRRLTPEEKERVLNYVQQLEESDYKVRCPFRDTPQEDEIGLRIVQDHEDDIVWADEIHVWWNPTSEGSLWDFAQARMAKRFMPQKTIRIINKIALTEHKSYTNVVAATHFHLSPSDTLKQLQELTSFFNQKNRP